MVDTGIGEKEETDRGKKDTDGVSISAVPYNSLEEDGLDTPSRTASLTPTMARTFEKRAAREKYAVDCESITDRTAETATASQPEATPSVKPNRKVRPTRRESTQSFTQAAHPLTGMQMGSTGQSPVKKASGDDAGEGGAGLSTSVSSNSKSGGTDTLAHLPVSTDNLLLHLHTDPRSSHITLSASAGAGAKIPPPAPVNPALLTAGGGGPSGNKSGSRNRASSSSSPSNVDKGKGKVQGATSLPPSRSVSKQPSIERPREAQRGYMEPNVRQPSRDPRPNLPRSFSSRSPISRSPMDSFSPSATSESADFVNATPSDYSGAASSPGPDATDTMGYFDHRPRAASSSGTGRSSASQGLRSTVTTPMEDWPSHDAPQVNPARNRLSDGEVRSMDFSSDLVVGALAGTPRFDTDFDLHQGPSTLAEVSPHTGTDAFDSFDSSPSVAPDPFAEPVSGLVPVTVSDSTAVKLETLVPGDVADKFDQTNDAGKKQAILGTVDGATTTLKEGTLPTAAGTPQTPKAAPAGLGFAHLDLSAAAVPSPSQSTATLPAVESGNDFSSDTPPEACIDEFSTLLAGAMMGTGRRSSSTSSSSSTKQKRGTTLIGTAGTLADAGMFTSDEVCFVVFLIELDALDSSPRTDIGTGVVQGTLAGKYPSEAKEKGNIDGKRLTSDWDQFIHAYKSGKSAHEILRCVAALNRLHCFRTLGSQPHTTSAQELSGSPAQCTSDITFHKIVTRLGAVACILNHDQCNVQAQSGNRRGILRYRLVPYEFAATPTDDCLADVRRLQGLPPSQA